MDLEGVGVIVLINKKETASPVGYFSHSILYACVSYRFVCFVDCMLCLSVGRLNRTLDIVVACQLV